MIVMKSVNKSYAKRTALAELKALLHNLMTCEILTGILNLSDKMGNVHG